MVRDKNIILAEPNDENTVLSKYDLGTNYIVLTIKSNHYLDTHQYTSSGNAILGKMEVPTSSTSIQFFPIIFGTSEQASKILGTDANGDLVWLDE